MAWSYFSRFLVFAGLSLLPQTGDAQWPAPEGYVADSRFEGFEVLTPSVLKKLQATNQVFITLAGSPGCGMVGYVSEDLLEYHKSVAPHVPVFIVDRISAPTVLRETRGDGAVPLLLIFRGSKIVDGQSGHGSANTGGTLGVILARQNLPHFSKSQFEDGGSIHHSQDWRNGTPKNIGKNFRHKTLSEIDLRHAVLKKADFAWTVVTHSNFQGADLEESNFKGSIWINTICPDGSNSDEHGYSCMGH